MNAEERGVDALRSRAAPLIELRDIRRSYHAGTSAEVEVLRGISMTIHAGEFVAIMGQSGSGKSTLMNILGLLDRPTGGVYRFEGRDVAGLDRDTRARLRREAFGFVFQQYNLIASLTALENVEMPAVYAGQPGGERRARAAGLLAMLGLGDRMVHRPNELSGGQQQRVSIARALVNGGRIILADEPTGALDTASGVQVMDLLTGLARDGHTVILITHDPAVAVKADRTIEIRDGRIVTDSGTMPPDGLTGEGTPPSMPMGSAPILSDLREAVRSGGRALLASPVRTGLTLLGIVVGIASVIALLAIGQGVKQSVIGEISVFGASRLFVVPGGEDSRGPPGRLLARDAELIGGIANVAAVMPQLDGSVTVRASNMDVAGPALAVSTDFPRVMMWEVEKGVFFNREDERSLATVAVIGSKLAQRLFPPGAVGRTVLVGNIQFQVIGVLRERGALAEDNEDESIVFPLSTGSLRVFGRQDLSAIRVLVEDVARLDATEAAIGRALEEAHHVRDFRIFNATEAIATGNRIFDLLTLLLAGTAAISLFVGGIGVMNVMLMTVTERTREIGIRMATGARTGDILRQFLTEAMMVAGAGGIVGLALGLGLGIAAAFLFGITVIFSLTGIATAVLCAVLTGLAFGFMPALRAARLDPVAALARE
ncbi:MacB family efflux pump subunit [Paenirhodobacter sp.]|uniref:MacB family efflux pump subunit n=1 Tax=Paenirhodobacter sp. TaxID=1965326 RepID=UPI003B3FAB9C